MLTGNALRSEIDRLFSVVTHRSTTDEVVIVCPQPGCQDSSGNRSINLKNGLTNCWRCNVGGPFVQWAKRLGYEVDQSAESTVSVDALRQMSFDLDKTAKAVQFVQEVNLPKGFIRIIDEPESIWSIRIGQMADRKNLTFDDLANAQVGFTREGSWEPFAIFPVWEWDRVVYYQGRTYVDIPGQSTKKFPSKHDVRFGSANWVYNIDNARKTRATTVIVVESILNVLSLQKELSARGLDFVEPVAVFKHHISSAQARKLLALRDVKEICLLYDADSTLAAKKEAQKFVGLRKMSVIEMPFKANGSTQDANDNAKLAVDLFLQRQFFDSADLIDTTDL